MKAFLKALKRPLQLLAGVQPGLSRWGWILVVAIQLVAFGFVFRAWIGPFILRSISKHVRVRSVSLRSVRGVFIRTAHATYRIDRIGLSYHPPIENARRFSVKVEGLFIEMHERKQCPQPSTSPFGGGIRMPTLSDFAPSPLGRRLWSFYSAIYVAVEPFLRPTIRTFFVVTLRIAIRCLPTLTQAIDLELDRALVTLSTQPEAHLTIESATLYTSVAFLNLEDVIGSREGEIHSDHVHRGFLNMAHLKSRFESSVKRVWERAWGQAKGKSSLTLSIRNVACFSELTKWSLARLQHANSMDFGYHYCASRYDYVTQTSHMKSICVDLPGSLEFVASLEFGPQKGIIEEHSVEASLKMPLVSISLDRLLAFLRSAGGKIHNTEYTGFRNVPELRPPILTSLNQSGGSSTLNKFVTSLPFPAWKKNSDSLNTLPGRSLLSHLRSVSFSIKETILLFATSGDNDSREMRTYRVRTHGFSASFRFSETGHDPLQCEFLGKPDRRRSAFDADVFSISIGSKDLIVDRRDNADGSPLVRVIYIGPIDLQGFVTQWSLLMMPDVHLLSGDPNAALLVIKLAISSPQLSERIDVIGQTLADLRKLVASPQAAKSVPSRRIIKRVPRLHVDVLVNDVIACLIPIDENGQPTSSVILSSTQCVISFSSHFNYFPLERPDFPDLKQNSWFPVEMEFNVQSLLGPAFVTSLPRLFALDTTNRVSRDADSSSRFGDPLLSLSTFELQMTGRTLGGVLEDTHQVILDSESTMTDLTCVTDAVSIELWQPAALSSLKYLLGFLRNLRSEHVKSEPTHLGFLDGLPIGLHAHFAVGQIGIILTGKDLTPGEDGDLTRGVALKSGLALQYCSLQNRRHFARIPRKFSHARYRQRLYLHDELIMDAIPHSNDLKTADDRFALFRCTSWDTVVRTSVATEFAADQVYEAAEEDEQLKSTEFLWIKRIQVDIFSSHFDRNGSEGDGQQKMRTKLKIPQMQARLQLFHAYCALLASSTVRSLFAASGPKAKYIPTGGISFSFEVTFGDLQVLCRFPLQEQICFRFNNLSLYGSNNGSFNVEWRVGFLWVPIPGVVGNWEELARLRSWKLSITTSTTEPLTIAVEGAGARLHIPHTYVLADLILDINMSFKCIRQLSVIVQCGRFSQISDPPAEEAKVVPVINVKLGCLTLEAADDPLESKLGLIIRAGSDAARTRQERDEAFDSKVAAIKAEEDSGNDPDAGLRSNGRFTAHHSVSIEDARQRLLQVHAISWTSVHREYREDQKRREDFQRRWIRGDHFHLSNPNPEPLVPLAPPSKSPPLIRIILTQLSLSITQPLYENCDLPDFMFDLGNGLPRDTFFSLLIPLHLNVALGSTCVTLRDYPLPLLNVPGSPKENSPAWAIDTDLVIAEEMGMPSSVTWKECPIVAPTTGNADLKGLFLCVPKTTMPVKTYANPVVTVLTSQLTELCWGVSYNPGIQDVMRIIDTLSTPPPDPSPPVGFWDKMRLMLHWRVKVAFAGEVHLNLKGSRDPYSTKGPGSGFAFCWKGSTELTIAHKNKDSELLQVVSDTMMIVIPDFTRRHPGNFSAGSSPNKSSADVNAGMTGGSMHFKKICAKFASGIKWGIGFRLERNCAPDCRECNGLGLCRHFNFKPHYEVLLEPKNGIPREKSSEDSFNEFRSDYIHLSTSLISSVRHDSSSTGSASNSFHLTPKTFAHFWSWWDLFDRFLSIPIRQGSLFPSARPPSKKFGRHLATLKYRLSIPQLFISHVYMDDSRQSWADGTTKFVGIKALVDLFEADMHQREQEAIVTGLLPNTTKKIRHKPFYAAEVKLENLQLRALEANFAEPLKQEIDMDEIQSESKNERSKDVNDEDIPKLWIDMDDFVEIDWQQTISEPSLKMLPIGACPRFTYFKRSTGRLVHAHTGDSRQATLESSRFGAEDTHVCLMGQEPSVHRAQADIVTQRTSQLRHQLISLQALKARNDEYPEVQSRNSSPEVHKEQIEAIQKAIRQLEHYIVKLRETDDQESPNNEVAGDYANYLMPSDISCPVDWTEFSNVYQFHCPKFTLANTTRDILVKYYYCSRSRRGFEYHLATRAVKFIRDQAKAILSEPVETDVKEKKLRNPTGAAAHAAAHALRKILIGNEEATTAIYSADTEDTSIFNPMDGWSDGVSLEKSHFCLLLKPQVVLRSEALDDSICVLAAVQATLQSFAILDTANVEDPVSGRVMTRSHAVLSGLQTFSPSATCRERHDGVPLEVLIDLRAESNDFDRLVPQTNATFRYDKFNRLRLRNNVTSVVAKSTDQVNGHLQHQMDLIDVRVPRFTVSADSKNFGAIANVITNLLLQSDAAHKLHLSKIETLLFSYDFTALFSAADVVEGLQSRLRRAVEQERNFETDLMANDEHGKLDLWKIKAHIFLLTEELNLIFDAIKLAQDKADDKHNDQKSALKVHAYSQEISWGMVDDLRDMIAKLAVRGIDFSWLSRQDGSVVNTLSIGDLQAFDGSPDAEWPEILAKYREPSNHPLVKRGTFVNADWTVLPPVGGITIYEQFMLEFHPMRIQLEARVGKSFMEYIWPARRERIELENANGSGSNARRNNGDSNLLLHHGSEIQSEPTLLSKALLDPPDSTRQGKRFSVDEKRPTLSPATKRVTSSRSFSDLRLASRQASAASPASSDPLYIDKDIASNNPVYVGEQGKSLATKPGDLSTPKKVNDDADEMRLRSAQKTFVIVRIASMHLLLSFRKDGSFFCRDAKIQTRELQYRNRTCSFEELAEHFIPSDPSWRGWMRVALHQPLVPVLPVARELFSKTKWIASKSKISRQMKKLGQGSSALSSTTTVESSGTANTSRPSHSSVNVESPGSPKSRRSRQTKRSTDVKEDEDSIKP